MELKVVISDPENGKSYQRELKDDSARRFKGKGIGEIMDGSIMGLQGYELRITGGSDSSGFAMKKGVHGTVRCKILMSSGVGYNPKRDVRKKKCVRGEIIDQDIVQVNTTIIKKGKKKIEELLGAEEKPPEEEKPVEEPKPAEEAPKEEEPKPKESKPEEKPPEAAEKAPKEEKAEEKPAKKEKAKEKPEEKPEKPTEEKAEEKPPEDQKPKEKPSEEKPEEPKPEKKPVEKAPKEEKVEEKPAKKKEQKKK